MTNQKKIQYFKAGIASPQIDERAKAIFEAEKNKRYQYFIDKINDNDGFYCVKSISRDGRRFAGELVITPDLRAEIQSFLN